jgi:Asp/Glu/hydantoin racemase
MENNRKYGYLHDDSIGKVKMLKGQNIAGYSIGVLYIDDVWYPMMPGNVVNATTYDFPVRLKSVKGLTISRLFSAEESVLEDLIIACNELEREGVRAISGACGFFGNFQKDLAERVNVPVAVSSLVQIPWISSIIKPNQKIGILTADKFSLTDKLLQNCGVYNRDRLIIEDLRHEPEFSCILEGRGEFDNNTVRNEVVSKALEIVNNNDDVGAILLECSDMPPYAYAVQEAVGLPVFDFITLINWLHNATTQKPYNGFI